MTGAIVFQSGMLLAVAKSSINPAIHPHVKEGAFSLTQVKPQSKPIKENASSLR